MKVTVTKYLNVRVGKPSLNAPCYQYLAPGSEIEVEEQTFRGDWYEGVNRWYHDKADNYYWTGGFADSEIIQNPLADYDLFLTGFPGNGSNVSVAILDSGINSNNPNLANGLIEYKSFLSSSDIQHISAHGSAIAGIITSYDLALKRNRCNLYCYRVADSKDRIIHNAVFEALIWISNNYHEKIDLINLSFDIVPSQVRIFQPIVDSLNEKGIVVIVSAGENNYANNIASLRNVLKIGTFDFCRFESVKTQLNPIYDLAFLNTKIQSYDNISSTLTYQIGQDSAYAAVAAALLAREMSLGNIARNHNRLLSAKNYFNSKGTQISMERSPKPFKIYIR